MFDKLLYTMRKNLAYTIVMIIAIIFFCAFSDGLLSGLIAAAAAVIAFACGALLYGEYKQAPTIVKATQKKSAAKKSAPAKKATGKKPAAQKRK